MTFAVGPEPRFRSVFGQLFPTTADRPSKRSRYHRDARPPLSRQLLAPAPIFHTTIFCRLWLPFVYSLHERGAMVLMMIPLEGGQAHRTGSFADTPSYQAVVLVLYFLILGLKQSFGVACLITEIPQSPPLPLVYPFPMSFTHVTCLDDIDLENTRGTTGRPQSLEAERRRLEKQASNRQAGSCFALMGGNLSSAVLRDGKGNKRGVWVGEEKSRRHTYEGIQHISAHPLLVGIFWGHTHTTLLITTFSFSRCVPGRTRVGSVLFFVSAIMFPSRFSARRLTMTRSWEDGIHACTAYNILYHNRVRGLAHRHRLRRRPGDDNVTLLNSLLSHLLLTIGEEGR